MDLQGTLDHFLGLSIAGENKIYDDWITALKEERKRVDEVNIALASAEDPWDTCLSKAGYRTGFPVFYMFYDKLRAQLQDGPFKNWAIYSGSNNPVLNWQDGWLSIEPKDVQIQLYWEFNWSSFRLKAQIEDKTTVRWNKLRPDLIELCSSCPIAGRKTANRKGTWVTAYKWEFDFCKETPSTITQKTIKILSHVHDQLHGIA